MLISFVFLIIALPIATMGLNAILHAWPVALSSAVLALVLYVRLDRGSARRIAAAEYQQRNAAQDKRSAAMIAEYHEVMTGVTLQQSIDRRDRRDLQEERQAHARKVRELEAEIQKAGERAQRLLNRKKRPPKPPKPPWPEDDEE